jgi:hypothetical protein
VERLITTVDARDDGSDPRTMSVSARHEAVLADGRRVLLLDGRGWTAAAMQMHVEGVPGEVPVRGEAPDSWARTAIESIESDARTVVGPDEPFGGHTQEEAEAGHWTFLANVLRRAGVVVAPQELKRLPHDVVCSDRLLARAGRRAVP